MNQRSKTSAMITTAALGMAVGTAAYMMTNHKPSPSKQIKKTTDRAMRQVEDFIDSVSYMMR